MTMGRRSRILLCLAVCLAAACALRIALRPSHLFSEDCINFARSLERFDPANQHPQPPGYPLFVLQSQLVHRLAPPPETTFLIGVIAATALALFLIVLVAGEMLRSWPAALAAAALLYANPAFLYTGLTSTIRVYVAAVTLLVVYFCWRLWRGESRCWPAAALALGLGSGYRPELLALLFPLWLVSAWRGKRTRREFWAGLALLAASAGVWIAFLLSRFAGLKEFQTSFSGYLANQARGFSPVYGAPADGWLRMLGMLIAWNGAAVVGWIVFAPLARRRLGHRAGLFLACWVLPPLVFHGLIHIGAADQALVTIPAFCLIGGAVLGSLLERRAATGALALAFALAVNLHLFCRPVLYPYVKRAGLKGNLLYMRKQIADGLWESSWRAFAEVHRESEAALESFRRALAQAPGNTLVVWNRSPVTWRKLSYYFPEQTFCLLLDELHTDTFRAHASCWRNTELLKRYDGDPVPVPLNGAGRIIWILGKHSSVRHALAGELRKAGDGGIYWTPARAVEVPGYRFVP